MRKIFHLSQDIISRISAGEVIERPAYAVKELIENAIDANASVIEIHIEESGLEKIVVNDNGEGMSKEDLELSFLPHTTSKLKDEDNLLGIKTLGFRGEALSSIAAISQMSIQSRTQDRPGGYSVLIKKGVVEEINPIGTTVGTIVIVNNLFHSVPARKKFLKSKKTEFRHITEIVMNYALSYPTIHFVLTHNKKTVLDLPKKITSIERIRLLLGQSLFDNLISFSYEDGYIKLEGFIGKPQSAAKQNQKQYLFINNRYVTDRIISLAVKEAFGTLLPSSATPVFLLNINIPHEMVDVNVHPRKEQIAFMDSKVIFDAVKHAVTQTLNENNLTFRLAKFKQEHSAKLGETTSFAGKLLKDSVLTPEKLTPGQFLKRAPLVQIDSTYIFTLTKDGLDLIDQHAAHERILYEQFVRAFTLEKKGKLNYQLSKPLTLHFSLAESQLIDEYLQQFTDLGFNLDHFQGNSFVIRSVPTVFKGRNIEKVIKDMLSDLFDETGLKTIDTRSQRMLVFLSCRAAIKAGDTLTQKQMRDIIKTLEKTPHNATCPHGRPTQIPLTRQELDKLFKRA